MLAPFSLKIGHWNAKFSPLEVFVCLMNFFGIWFPKKFSVLLCVFLAGRSAAVALMRRNILLEIHATEHATKAPQTQEYQILHKIQIIGGKLMMKIILQGEPLQIEDF